MRNARIKATGAGYYHAMSRIIERRYILGERKKERLLHLMHSLAAFGGLEILTYAFLRTTVSAATGRRWAGNRRRAQGYGD